jgi:hypothetical protein
MSFWGVHDLMRRGRGVRSGFWVALGWALCGVGPTAAGELDGCLFTEISIPGERFGLVQENGAEPALHLEDAPPTGTEGKKPPSPILAGFLSALVPGSGQFLQGQGRGWIYLGVEAAGWFSYLAVHDAAAQGETDYQEYADANWSLARYDTVGSCGPGLGPDGDPAGEREALLDDYENNRDQFYQDIADDKVYACGWGNQNQRDDYQSMINDSDNLYTAAQYVVAGIVLNHIVSAIDAAKSAADKRKAASHSWRWNVSPEGLAGLRLEVGRSF